MSKLRIKNVCQIIFVTGLFQIVGTDRCNAQVVQLPVTHTFSYTGSVSAPDSGSAYLGGLNSSSQARRRRRGALGHGIGGNQAASAANVSVTIIDQDAMDRQIRGLPPRGTNISAQTQRSYQARTLGSQSLGHGATSPSRSTRRYQGIDPYREGKALVRYARKMRLQGNDSVSKLSYQLAIKKLGGRLRELAQAEYQKVYGDMTSRY